MVRAPLQSTRAARRPPCARRECLTHATQVLQTPAASKPTLNADSPVFTPKLDPTSEPFVPSVTELELEALMRTLSECQNSMSDVFQIVWWQAENDYYNRLNQLANAVRVMDNIIDKAKYIFNTVPQTHVGLLQHEEFLCSDSVHDCIARQLDLLGHVRTSSAQCYSLAFDVRAHIMAETETLLHCKN